MTTRRIATIAFTAIALAAAGCGGDDGGSVDDGSAIDGDPSTPLTGAAAKAVTSGATEAEKPAGPKFDKAKLQKIPGDTSKKPKIPKPAAMQPPEELVTVDVVEGKGKPAKKGDKVSVQYVGVTWSEGKEFDASWGRGEPFEFTLGEGQVIKGWDEGVAGMKVGGRRELVIPAELAYGSAGSPPNIGPDEALVFVVDLEKVS